MNQVELNKHLEYINRVEIKNRFEYIKEIEKVQSKIPYLYLVDKIKRAGSINVLNHRELKNYILYERLEFEKNRILLNISKHRFKSECYTTLFCEYYQAVAHYLFEIIKNPIGYTRVEGMYKLLNTYSEDKRIIDPDFYMHVLNTIDPDNPLVIDSFGDNEALMQKYYQYYNYLLLRKKFDYCKNYCESTYFKDDIIRYQLFEVHGIESYFDTIRKAKKFKTSEYESLLNGEYINTLKKYPM